MILFYSCLSVVYSSTRLRTRLQRIDEYAFISQTHFAKTSRLLSFYVFVLSTQSDYEYALFSTSTLLFIRARFTTTTLETYSSRALSRLLPRLIHFIRRAQSELCYTTRLLPRLIYLICRAQFELCYTI